MEKTEEMPMWVYLAFSSIPGRKWAVWLVRSCVLFSLYCIPWPLFFQDRLFLKKICPFENWIWFAMMVLMTLWYWLCLKWMDDHRGWELIRR